MNKIDLKSNIDRLEKQALYQKDILEKEFGLAGDQLKPGKIVQNLFKQAFVKFKSILPKFSNKSTRLQ